MRKLLVLGIGLTLAGLVGWFLDTRGVNAQIVATAVSGIPLMGGALDELLERRGKPKQQRVAELVQGEIYRNPLIVSIYLLLIFQLLQRVLGIIVGGAIGGALGALRFPTNLIQTVAAAASPLVVVIISLPVSVILAKYAAHRIRSRPFLWISGAFIVSQVLSEAVAYLYVRSVLGQASFSLPSAVIVCLLLVGAAGIGTWWARRTHQTYLMSCLFDQLSQTDQRELIDLVQTLPGVPK
jgi:hypothetical protein